MNDKRFSKVLLVILLVLAVATTNAVEAIQSGQELSPDPANENNSFGSVTSLTEANGSITGTVTDGTKPLNGILVDVFRWTGSGYDWTNLATTDALGTYDVGYLSTGIYRVQFSDMAGIYFTEYYDDAPDLDSATDISVTTGSATSGIDAVLAEGGHIKGTVTDGTNLLPGIEVTVYYWSGSDYSWLNRTYTDASGDYDVVGLQSGIYRIQFSDFGPPVTYLSEYYDDAPDLGSATDIGVTVGSTTSGIDAVLTERGHIKGTVTDGTNPIPNIHVRAYRWTGSGYYWDGPHAAAHTDASGDYDIDSLPSGTYRVQFYDFNGVYIREFYDDALDLDSATDISVTDGSMTSGIDAVLTAGGRITGNVTSGTNPLYNIDVRAYRWTGSYYNLWDATSTNTSGYYEMVSLPAGTYRVEYHDDNGVYSTEYYDDAPDLESATDISVTLGSTVSGIDAEMVEWGHISGTVTDGSNPIPYFSVDIYRWTGSAYDWWAFTSTDSSGNYNVGGLSTGTYRVGFRDITDTYYPEYYDDAPNLESATDISVVLGSTTTGIDAVLAEWGRITGTVTDGTNPLPNILIKAYLWTGSNYEQRVITWTDHSGHYVIEGLRTGTYLVQFSTSSESVYAGEWYDDKLNMDNATEIGVAVGSTTSGIDAVLIEGGRITGNVSDGINPLSNIYVSAYRWTGNGYELWESTHTDMSGNYAIKRLPTGTYRVRFQDDWLRDIYSTEYYDDAPDLDSATDISVTAGSTTSGIDAILGEEEGQITGTVTDGTNPLKDIQVKIYHWTGNDDDWTRYTYTDTSGNYEVNNLPPGTYRIRFRDKKNDLFITEYYDDAPDLDSATDVSVTAGLATSGIDAVLAESVGRITGTVTDGTDPLHDIQVKVYRWEDDDDDWTRSTYTDVSGNYILEQLPPGTYRIRFYDKKHDVYITEYYDDAPDLDSASDIGVTAGSTTSAIDAVLAEWSHILGTVSDGTNPIANIEVRAYGYLDSDWEEVSRDTSDASGNYDVDHLPAGTYRIRFRDSKNGVYTTEYYDDAPNLISGNDIRVTAGSSTPGIDAVLAAEASHITGSVTDGTNPLTGIEVMVCSWVGVGCDDAVYGSTDASGNYDVGGLSAGVYRLRFKDDSGVYLTEWYDDAPNDNSASNVNVAAGVTIGGINAALTEGGHISGTVTDGTNPLGNILVTVYGPADWLSSTSTDGSGNYDVGGLPTGSYQVRFSDDSGVFVTEYFDDAPDLSSATDVSVTASMTTSGIDAVLAAKVGRITGTVTDGTNPLQDIEVKVYHWTGSDSDWSKTTFTNVSGNYDVDGLPAGIYRIRFHDNAGVYSSEYYDDADDLDNATDVSVTASMTTSGIDASLIEEDQYSIYLPSILAK